MTVEIEVCDLREVAPDLLKKLKRLTFGREGWMAGCVDQIVKGKLIDEDGIAPDRPLNFNRGSILIAREEEKIVGWALVRHPRKRSRYGYYKDYKYYWGYSGVRPDFQVYVRSGMRGKQIGRKLLLVAYNNFGKMDAFPHDSPSRHFFTSRKNKKFVCPQDTARFNASKFEAYDVY